MENNENDSFVESEDEVSESADVTEQTTESEEEETVDIDSLKAEMDSLRKENADLAEKIAKKRIKARKENKVDSTKQTTDGLDYAEKAYLNTEGIKEFDFVQKQMQESGIQDVDSLINNSYFKAALQEHRDARAVAEATPSGTRSDSKPANTKVDFWLDKGELPPNQPEYRQLRRDVVNERVKREEANSKFTHNSIVSN